MRGAVFERLLAVMPDSSAPLENLGVLALEQGDVAGARQYFERAIALAPGSSRAHAGAGATVFRGGDRAAAYAAWAHAVQLDPANYDALLNLGVNLARDGRIGRGAAVSRTSSWRTAPPGSPRRNCAKCHASCGGRDD